MGRIQTRQVKESSRISHDDRLKTLTFAATLLIPAGRAALLPPLILDLPRCLAFSEGPEQTRVASVWGEGGAQSGTKKTSPLWLCMLMDL